MAQVGFCATALISLALLCVSDPGTVWSKGEAEPEVSGLDLNLG